MLVGELGKEKTPHVVHSEPPVAGTQLSDFTEAAPFNSQNDSGRWSILLTAPVKQTKAGSQDHPASE